MVTMFYKCWHWWTDKICQTHYFSNILLSFTVEKHIKRLTHDIIAKTKFGYLYSSTILSNSSAILWIAFIIVLLLCPKIIQPWITNLTILLYSAEFLINSNNHLSINLILGMRKIAVSHPLTELLLWLCCYTMSFMRKKIRFRVHIRDRTKQNEFLLHGWHRKTTERQKQLGKWVGHCYFPHPYAFRQWAKQILFIEFIFILLSFASTQFLVFLSEDDTKRLFFF
jgi:hypothetical protein